jgi:inhibitor of KinA
MNNFSAKIYPLGDAALTVSFGNEISPELNDKVITLARFIEQNPFRGFLETVPAYSSLAVFYDVLSVRDEFPDFPAAFEAVKNFVEKALLLRKAGEISETKRRLIEIPVDFDKKSALDLKFVASVNGLKQSEVIEIFTAGIYRVFFLGFLPGFAYMGEVDERIAAPRKDSPRKKVPRGSVGIAGRQTGIYSLESPGGWQIIGKTAVELFTPENENPTFLQAGDSVKFVHI